MKGCLQLALVGVLGIIGLGLWASLNRSGVTPPEPPLSPAPIVDRPAAIPESKPAARPLDVVLPAYMLLFANDKIGGGRFGDVLIPSFSLTTPARERGEVAERIRVKEGLTDLSIYSTREAYQANVSATYGKAHPGALEKGFLGSISDGRWTPAE